MSKPNIVLQTDFGLNTGFVCAMYGVIKSVDGELNVYDMTHQIREFDFRQASNLLCNNVPFWPKGTIFVSVVDPGVGTDRRACVAKLGNGCYIVTPDNGTLTLPLQQFGVEEVREIDENVNRIKWTEKANTFHGRDLFAYCAARLAAGVIDFSGVGPAYPVEEIVTYKIEKAAIEKGKASGELISALKQFGNLNLNIGTDEFEKTGIVHGDMVHVVITKNGETLFDGDALYHRSFGFVDEGAPILFNGSSGTMGFGLNKRHFADTYLPGVFEPGSLYSDYKISIEKI